MKFANKKTGFTLIELTIVISILLGLIGLLVIGVQAYLKSVERTSCLLNMSNIAKEIQGQDLLDETYPSNVTRAEPILSLFLLNYNEVLCPAQERLRNSNITNQYPFSGYNFFQPQINSDYYIAIHPPSNLTNTTLSGGINFQLQNKSRVSVICFASLNGPNNSIFGPVHRLNKTIQY